MKYYIYMEELDDLEEGYCCGHAERSNASFYRTDNVKEADFYDDYDAVRIATRYRGHGYPCKVVPHVSAERRLEILEGE